jgi:arginine exporter protein ArgO
MHSPARRAVAALWVTIVIGLVPQKSLAHGQALADGLFVVFVLIALAALAGLALFVAGVVALARARANHEGRTNRARWLGFANVLVGGIALAGTAATSFQSADGWKLALVGVPFLALGVALLRAVGRTRKPRPTPARDEER